MTQVKLDSPRIAYVNLFARDVEALSRFYIDLFGFPEIVEHRSPIYRCLDAGGVELGFNALGSYDLLGLSGRRPPTSDQTLRVYVTVEIAAREGVDHLTMRCSQLGGRSIKSPYETYYNAWQAVLEDPEGNVFRINHRLGPRRPAGEIADPPWLR